MESLFIGFFKDTNGDIHSVARANKQYKVDGAEYATGLYYTDNLSVYDYAIFDKLPADWVKVDSPV